MVLSGADIALERHPGAQFLLFGDSARITPLLARLPRLAEAATVHHTDPVRTVHELEWILDVSLR